jgi:hypothetical protein
MSDTAETAEQQEQTAEVAEPESEPTSDLDEPESPQEPPEQPDESDVPLGAASPAEGQPEALTEKEMERALKALDREAVRHAERVRDIMGADYEALQPCPMCAPNIPGFRWPVAPAAEQLARIKEAIGEPITPDYSDDPYSAVCVDCGGYGLTRTGSKVPGQATVQCYSCKGTGWRPVGPERATYTPGGNGPSTVTADASQATAETQLPPEAQRLKDLGFIVVPPPQVPAPPAPAVTP